MGSTRLQAAGQRVLVARGKRVRSVPARRVQPAHRKHERLPHHPAGKPRDCYRRATAWYSGTDADSRHRHRPVEAPPRRRRCAGRHCATTAASSAVRLCLSSTPFSRGSVSTLNKIPLCDSSIHILEVPQKRPYNPNHYATRVREPSNGTTRVATEKTGDEANHAYQPKAAPLRPLYPESSRLFLRPRAVSAKTTHSQSP